MLDIALSHTKKFRTRKPMERNAYKKDTKALPLNQKPVFLQSIYPNLWR